MSHASKVLGALLEKQFTTASGVGTRKSHLDHCCFMRKDLECAPQLMPGPQLQLGGLVGLVGSRWKTRWKIGRGGGGGGGGLGPQALSQGHNHYTTQPATQIHIHIHTHTNSTESFLIKLQFFFLQNNKGKKKRH